MFEKFTSDWLGHIIVVSILTIGSVYFSLFGGPNLILPVLILIAITAYFILRLFSDTPAVSLLQGIGFLIYIILLVGGFNLINWSYGFLLGFLYVMFMLVMFVFVVVVFAPKSQEPLKTENGIPSDDSRYIPSEVKRFVMERDHKKCVLCGSTHNLEYDHDIPVSQGGSNTTNNIRILCKDCNRRKSERIE